MKFVLTYSFVLFVFTFTLPVKAQNNVDSLKKLAATSLFDTVRIAAYHHLTVIYSQKNATLSKAYADSTLLEISKFENIKGWRFYEQYKAMAYNNIGNVAFQQGNFNDAVKYCIKSLKIYEEIKSDKNIARLQNNLASVLKAIGNIKEALYYYRKCRSTKERIYNKNKALKPARLALATSYLNLGSAFGDLGVYDSSFYYLKGSLNLLDTNERSDNLGLIYISMGHVNRKLKKYPESIYYSQKALDVYHELGLPESMSLTYQGLAETYFELKKFNKALTYLDIAQQIDSANSLNDDLINIYHTKMLTYEQLKDKKNELIYLKKYAKLKDSVLNQNHNLQIEELKTQYETEKKEKEIVKLNKDNKIQDLQLEKETATRSKLTTVIVSIVLVIFLLGILIWFLYKTIIERKKAYVKLQEKNIEIQNQTEKLSEQSKILSRYQSQMSEFFVFGALKHTRDLVLKDDDGKAIQQLQLFSKLMRETLNNSEKENIGLDKEVDYLRNYINFEQERFGTRIEFITDLPVDPDELLIPPMLIQPLIEHIIKQSITNNNSKIIIQLLMKIENDLLNVSLLENGTAFDRMDRSQALSVANSKIEMFLKAAKIKMQQEYFELFFINEPEAGSGIKFVLPLIYKY